MMNRRSFLSSGTGTVALLSGAISCQTKRLEPSQKDLLVTDNGKLAGLTLEELKQQYRYDLFDDFLPFMEKYIIDHELGGFMCNTDRDGTTINTNKNAWYVGRGIWVYSFLYNELAHEETYLEVARKAVEFILRNPPRGDDLWPVEYTREGKPIPPQGQYIGGKYVPVSKEVYGDLFIADGLTEYARAVNDDKYWNIARDIMFKCIRIFDRPDYAPHAPKIYIGPDASELPGARPLGVWMLLLRLTSQMLNQKDDPDVGVVAQRCIDAVLNHHYNPEYDLINEILNHDMSRPDNEYRDLVYTGHGIEIMWMMLYEAFRLKDEKLFNQAAQLLRRHMEVAWDGVYGGLFRGLTNVDKNTWILDKALWVQEESLIGTLFISEHTGAQWAKDWFSRIFTYVHDKFPLRKHGYALWDMWPDRKVTFVEHYPRIENFHHPRHLMLNLTTLERMIKRGGKVSGVFA